MLKLSLWVAFTDVSSLSLQFPKIVYLPQAIKSLLFTNQKRTNKFHCSTITRGPKNCRKGTKRGTNFWQMGIQRGPFLTYVKGDLKFEFFRFVHKQWICWNSLEIKLKFPQRRVANSFPNRVTYYTSGFGFRWHPSVR